MSTPDLKEIHDFLVSLAHKAGDIINNALPDNSGTGSKKNSTFAGQTNTNSAIYKDLLIRESFQIRRRPSH